MEGQLGGCAAALGSPAADAAAGPGWAGQEEADLLPKSDRDDLKAALARYGGSPAELCPVLAAAALPWRGELGCPAANAGTWSCTTTPRCAPPILAHPASSHVLHTMQGVSSGSVTQTRRHQAAAASTHTRSPTSMSFGGRRQASDWG